MNRPPEVPNYYVQLKDGSWSHPSRLVVGTLPTKPKQNPVPALDQGKKTRPRGKRGVVVCVTLIRFGHKLLDDDNLRAAFKATRDSVSTSLGIDDGDRRLRWQYSQVETKGRVGSLVKLELL